jgi:apolipoprotein N-acyltransferase
VSSPSPKLWIVLLACAFSGATQALASPPLNWFWLQPWSFVPLLLVASRLTPGKALFAGWWFGIAANLAIFHWIFHTVKAFTGIPAPLCVLILVAFSAFWGFYGAVFAWGLSAIRRGSGVFWPAAAAAWFAACEYLNPQLFPFFQGVAWYQQPRIFLAVAIAGVPFISFLLLWCNGILADAWERRRAGQPLKPVGLHAAAFAVVLIGCFAYSSARLDAIEQAEAKADSIKVALMQPNRDVFAAKAIRRLGRTKEAEDLVQLAQQVWDEHGDIDAFVFPEGSLRGRPDHRFNKEIRRFVRRTGAELWMGGGDAERRDNKRVAFFNSGFRVHGDEADVDVRYDKNILLPFGEFMPFVDLLPFLEKIQGPGSYEAGQGLNVYNSPHADFVFLVCYEAIRHRFVRGGVRAGANLLTSITYDDWYGATSEQSQHLMLTAIQSALYGVPLIRATTTGITASVDARGVIEARTPFRERTALVREIKPLRVPSPYTVVGDWFVWLCVLCSSVLLVRGKVRKGRWRELAGIGFAALWVPMLWFANAYQPTGDWVAWLVVLATLGVVALQWRQEAEQ